MASGSLRDYPKHHRKLRIIPLCCLVLADLVRARGVLVGFAVIDVVRRLITVQCMSGLWWLITLLPHIRRAACSLASIGVGFNKLYGVHKIDHYLVSNLR